MEAKFYKLQSSSLVESSIKSFSLYFEKSDSKKIESSSCLLSETFFDIAKYLLSIQLDNSFFAVGQNFTL